MSKKKLQFLVTEDIFNQFETIRRSRFTPPQEALMGHGFSPSSPFFLGLKSPNFVPFFDTKKRKRGVFSQKPSFFEKGSFPLQKEESR